MERTCGRCREKFLKIRRHTTPGSPVCEGCPARQFHALPAQIGLVKVDPWHPPWQQDQSPHDGYAMRVLSTPACQSRTVHPQFAQTNASGDL